jgi:hypothetical protein
LDLGICGDLLSFLFEKVGNRSRLLYALLMLKDSFDFWSGYDLLKADAEAPGVEANAVLLSLAILILRAHLSICPFSSDLEA